jgi:hypothetical protein
MGRWRSDGGRGRFVETAKSYRKNLGYRHLWVPKAHLDDQEPVAQMMKAS